MNHNIKKIKSFTDNLPLAPERIAFYAGSFSIANSVINIEFGDPILGGIQTIVGTLTVAASLNSKRTIESMDNRGSL